MKRNTENVTGNRPNMDRKRCSERSTDDGDLEKKDEENVIIIELNCYYPKESEFLESDCCPYLPTAGHAPTPTHSHT